VLTLYMVRHGESECNLGGYFQGQIDTPLTEKGLRQAKAAAERLAGEGLQAVYASDLDRARTTGEAIASRCGLAVVPTSLLRECSMGDVQGITPEEYERRYPESYRAWKADPFANRPPGAERFQDVIDRSAQFLAQVAKEHRDGAKIAAVGHFGSISALICAALGLSVDAYLCFHVGNASVSTIEVGDAPILRLLNETCHLSGIV